MNINLIEKLKENKVLPIIRSTDPQDVINKVKALLDGGLDVMEVNVETPNIFNAIKAVSNDATICAGGIITSIQAQAAIDSGAKIISSPIFQSNLLKISKDKRLPFIEEHQQQMRLTMLGNQEFLLLKYILLLQWAA